LESQMVFIKAIVYRTRSRLKPPGCKEISPKACHSYNPERKSSG
jgi:hypothetical protein